jgi:hypothetical protein
VLVIEVAEVRFEVVDDPSVPVGFGGPAALGGIRSELSNIVELCGKDGGERRGGREVVAALAHVRVSGWRLRTLWVAVLGAFEGHLDILRLMTLGLTRSRRMLSPRNISEVASVIAAANRSGGKGRLIGDLAADHP